LVLFDFRRKTTAILVMKNLFDAQSEEAGGPKRERQARIELARLDGVDGLPGHSSAPFFKPANPAYAAVMT
jgi:hypothetical protein